MTPVSLSLFIISGLGIVAVILLKRFQDSHDLLMFWPRHRIKIDTRIQKGVHRLQDVERMGLKVFYVFFHWLVVKGKQKARLLEIWLDKKSRNLVSAIRGRQILHQRGKASHFLHDITHFRDHFRK
jgi:hypothetical protein